MTRLNQSVCLDMPANLINPQSIEQYLGGFSQDAEVSRLLTLALSKLLAQRNENLEELRELPKEDAPKWLQQRWPEGGPYYQFKPDANLDQKVRHIADWMSASVQEAAPWVSRIDTVSGKPFRFNGIRTVDEASSEADKDMRQRNRRLAGTLTAVGEGERTVMKLEEGFGIVELQTPEALDREGVKMGHCIGQGSYDSALKTQSHRFFSLRDAKGEPHATLEVKNATKALLQCQGKENNPPTAKYLPHVAAFIKRGKFQLKVPARNTGLIEHEGNYYSINDIPENVTINGSLDLSGTRITSLPDGLNIGGSLNLSNTPITLLPKGLSVGGHLRICGTPITSLPDGLNVGGDLDLSRTLISSLPDGLSAGGALILSGTPITSLPDGLSVGGNLNLRGTPVTSLPDGLSVGGALNLSGTRLTSLPDGLSVGGNLDLSGTPITSLPDGLSVGGDLDLTGTLITKIPSDAKIAEEIFGLPQSAVQKSPKRDVPSSRSR